MKKQLFLLCLFFTGFAFAQRIVPGGKETQAILITNATIHVGNGNVIENGNILFDNGVIQYVGKENPVHSENTKIIDASGSSVYPGFILLNTILGLQEIGSVRASRDYYELEDFSPNVRSLVAYNTDSDIIPTVRSSGVLLAQVRPYGGTVPGTSSVVQLDAWNWEDAVVSKDNGVHLEWPRYVENHGDWTEPEPDSRNAHYDAKVKKIKKWFKISEQYCASASKIDSKNIKLEAMCGIFDGSKKLYVSAHREKEIYDAVQFLNEQNIKDKIIVDAEESYLLADMLKENGVKVILHGPFRIPSHAYDDYNLSYKSINNLLAKDVLVAIEIAGSDFSTIRNLPFLAGHLVGYGVDKEKALQLITQNAAKILGIDNKFGTIEKGKSATLFISSGDALDMMTNDVMFAFIDGRQVNLDTKQKQLYHIFSNKPSEK